MRFVQVNARSRKARTIAGATIRLFQVVPDTSVSVEKESSGE